MKTPAYLIGAIVIVLLIWLVPATLSFQGHVSSLHAAADAVADQYTVIGEAHAKGLADAAAGTSRADEAQTLVAAFAAIGRAGPTHEKLIAVDALQRRLGAFFADANRPAELVADAHFIALNQELTGRGKSSMPVFEYNKAASVVREDMKGFPGGALGMMMLGGEPPLLFLDGVPKDIKVML